MKKCEAREDINDFVDQINEIGQGLTITKDIVLKACLVLCHFDVFIEERVELLLEKLEAELQ